MMIKNVTILDNDEISQSFPIELHYIEDGKEYKRLTSAKEILDRFKNAERPTNLNKLFEEYLSTLDGIELDEHYFTEKDNASFVFEKFMAWLEKR